MRLVWTTGVLAAALFAAIATWLAPLHPGPLALQLTFPARSFGAIVHSWSPEQLQRYREHFPAGLPPVAHGSAALRDPAGVRRVRHGFVAEMGAAARLGMAVVVAWADLVD